jgi:hypothetical protein
MSVGMSIGSNGGGGGVGGVGKAKTLPKESSAIKPLTPLKGSTVTRRGSGPPRMPRHATPSPGSQAASPAAYVR